MRKYKVLIGLLIVSSMSLVGCNNLIEKETDEKELILKTYENEKWVDNYEGIYVKNYLNSSELLGYSKTSEFVSIKNYNVALDEIYNELIKTYGKDINNKNFDKEAMVRLFNSKKETIESEKEISNNMFQILNNKEILILENLSIETEDDLLNLKDSYNKLDSEYFTYINTIERSKVLEEDSLSDYKIEVDRALLKDLRESEVGSMGLSYILEEITNLNRVSVIEEYLKDLENYYSLLKEINFDSKEILEIKNKNEKTTGLAIEKLKEYIKYTKEKNYEESNKVLKEIREIK